MKSSITKYIVGAVVVIAFVGYLIFSNRSSAPATTATVTPTSTGSNDSSNGTTTTPAPTNTTGYKDGTYTGSVADAFYGNLQVSVTIKGGLIADVTYPQFPNAAGNTTAVSARALPLLKQEAITMQSANVNTVSGATQDSEAFNQSLAVALAQAK